MTIFLHDRIRTLIAIFCIATNGCSRHTDADVDNASLTVVLQHGAVIVRNAENTAVESVTFTGNHVTRTCLTHLQSLGPFRKLIFDACPDINDEVIEGLVALDSLESLNLGGTEITDRGLARLRGLPELRQLFLWRTHVTDKGLSQLANLQHLEVINLWDTETTNLVVHDLLLKLPKLRRVYLGSSPQGQTIFQTGEWTPAVSRVTQEAVTLLRQKRPDIDVVFWSGSDAAEAPKAPLVLRESDDRITIQVEQHSAFEAPIQSTAHSDWPGFLGPHGNGSSPEKLTNREWKIHPPVLIWKRRTGEGLSAPSVSRGRLIYTEREENSEHIVCLSTQTGEELWIASVPSNYDDALGYSNGPRSTPVIDDEHVYIMTATGILCCLSVTSGESIWTCDTTSEFSVHPNLYGVGSTPIVFGTLLITVVGGEAAENGPAGIVAFDKRTGNIRYATTPVHASYASVRIIHSETGAKGVAFVREGVVLFNPHTGEELGREPWAARVSGCVNGATPVVHENEFFISEAYGPGSALFRVKGDALQIKWRDPKASRIRALRAHWSTPVYHAGYLYGCSGRHSADGELRCIEWSTGNLMWARDQKSMSSLCLVDGHLINFTEYGRLEIIAARPDTFQPLGGFVPGLDGRPAAENEMRLLKFPSWVAPVFANGTVYVRGRDHLAAFDAKEILPSTTQRN